MKSTAKRLLLGLVMIVCLTVLMAICVGAEDVTYSEGLEFTSKGDGTCYVSGIGTCTDSVVHIPPVSPDGDAVTVIGNVAFIDCTGLTSITIPESVKSIDAIAFLNCSGLTSITIPESVKSIDNTAFVNCSGLTSISVTEGNSVYHSANNCIIETASKTLAFGCQTSVIPDDGSVTVIGSYAFAGCWGLTSIEIPDSVTDIQPYAFNGCNQLIQIESGVEYVEKWAIRCAADVTEATLRVDTVGIARMAFSGCRSLKSITIPEGVTSIGEYAFQDCWGLTNVTIPGSVTSMGEFAFCKCKGLKNVIILEGVASIGDSAFYACTGLTSITIPESVTSICDYAFYNCTGLTSITIPESVNSIGRYAFEACTGLTSINIPDSVTNIGGGAFGKCTGLKSLTVADGNTVFYSQGNCIIQTDTQEVVFGCPFSEIPSDGSIRGIGTRAFWGLESLTSITIPESVTNIGDYAFAMCTGLASITISEGVTSIGDYAFGKCTGLTSITIPESVTSIGDHAFYACTGLTSITIPESVISIGNGAFYDCTGLTSITIPESVTSIGDHVFCNCTSLTSITIPESVTSIGVQAFSDCRSLKSIIIPSNMNRIELLAFYYCNALTDVYYNGVEEEWGKITIGSLNTPLTNATIHFLGDATVKNNTEATCTESGEITYECGCGSTHTFFRPALGHTEITDTAVDPSCTSTGLTEGKHCSVCGEILVAQETVPTTDHSFTKYAHNSNNHWFICENCGDKAEDAVEEPHKFSWTVTDNTNEDEDKLSCTLRYQCACGYGKEEPIITGTAKITGASLALGDTLTLRYYAILPADNMNIKMRFTYEGETHDVIGQKDEKSSEYVFSLDRIPPSKMDAIVKAELILKNDDGSETVLAVKEEYSITQYCQDAKQDNPDDGALNLLLNDLETYNKAAEDYENGISKDPSDVDWEPLTDTDFSLSEPVDETVRFKAAGVRFGFVNRLFFKFTADDLNGLTVKVNDTLYTVSDFTLVEGTENTYIIYSEGINATEFDKIFTAVLLVNGEEVQTLVYSVKSYVEAKQDDPEIGALVRSLYNYGKSSELYRDEM